MPALDKKYQPYWDELRSLSAYVNDLLERGEFHRLPYKRRRALIRDVKRLYGKLRGPVEEHTLRRVLAAAGILAVTTSATSCDCIRQFLFPGNTVPIVVVSQGDITISAGEEQVFTAVVTDPDKKQTHTFTWYVDGVAQTDVTGDTFTFSATPSEDTSYIITVVVSDGTDTAEASVTVTVTVTLASSPSFATASQNPFGIQVVDSPVAPAFVDIDGDGDFDLFAGAGGESAGVISLLENTGSSSSPSFAAPADYAGLPEATTPTYTFLGPVPEFAPLTGGPYWDALVGHSENGVALLEYYTNTGSAFTSDSIPAGNDLPTNLPNSTFGAISGAVVDIDGDGLLDVMLSTSDGSTNTIDFFRNTGIAYAPYFVEQGTSFGLDLPAGAFGFPTFVDIDADGDSDAFVGNENGDIYYFQNTGTATAPTFAAPVQNPFGLAAVPAGPAVPKFVDIDNDRDFDLFVGDANGDLWFFENTNL